MKTDYRKNLSSKKLTLNYKGPYSVCDINSPVNYTILFHNS